MDDAIERNTGEEVSAPAISRRATYDDYLTADGLDRNTPHRQRATAPKTDRNDEATMTDNATTGVDATEETAPSPTDIPDSPDDAGDIGNADGDGTKKTVTTRRFPLPPSLAKAYDRFNAMVRPVLSRLWGGWTGTARIILYVVMFALFDAAAVITLQISAYTKDNTRNTYGFVAKMWELGHFQFMLNFIIAGMVYALLIFLLNRFWIATALFSILIGVASVANYFKTVMRNEPIIPADLTFLKGNTGEILSFVPDGYEGLVTGTVTALAIITAVCLVLHILDNPKPVLPMKRFKAVFIPLRITIIASLVFALSFVGSTLGVQNSWTRETAVKVFSDTPQLWSSLDDAQHNGPLVNFTRLIYSKAMDKPEGYSKETMERVAKRYQKAADSINDTRANDITDSTVVMILSETFSDPNRVPGLNFTVDPMPHIRALKQNTTSGLMLSPGYGGGTANIEFQALTGLSLANFDPSMAVPYQQLVPKLKWASSFNQIWNDDGKDGSSIAFHPYYRNMYLRDTNYKKFGFSQFQTLDGSNVIKHQGRLGRSPYVSDEQSYRNILDAIDGQQDNESQFIQMVTMQNHMPYTDWYPDNEFFNTDIDTSGLPDSERYLIDTYAKGVQITDQATRDFLDQLDQMDKPVTVIFYGDHLPGIYPSADSDKRNTLKLHETDYFIWSNAASGASSNAKLDERDSAYTSSNYFMAMAAQHMDAKVSPYLAMLTRLHERIPAMSTVIAKVGGIGVGKATYLNAEGKRIDPDTLGKQAKRLLEDYRLVQYDMTIGKGYLKDLGFTAVPKSR